MSTTDAAGTYAATMAAWEGEPAPEHTCHGAVFCGQPREAAQAACPACQLVTA